MAGWEIRTQNLLTVRAKLDIMAFNLCNTEAILELYLAIFKGCKTAVQ